MVSRHNLKQLFFFFFLNNDNNIINNNKKNKEGYEDNSQTNVKKVIRFNFIMKGEEERNRNILHVS